ncbi:MAG: NAD-dependent epimerase/dehydratase family protein [Leptospiraceae bacterium]
MSRLEILVTGGTGFIGSHVVRAGLDRGHGVTILSLGGSASNPILSGARFLQCDLADKQQVKDTVSPHSFDYVIHLGGYIDHASFREGGREMIDSHFSGLMNLVQALDWSRLKRFIQIGSSDEYGDAESPQTEESPVHPISSYSFAKLAGSEFLQMLHRIEDFPAVILRLFLVYGPGQDNRRFIPQIIHGCLKDQTFPASEGHQIRDFCYVGDVVRGIFAAMDCEKANGKIINLASGVPVRIRDVVEKVQKTVGMGNPQYGKIAYREGENMSLYADTTRARELLGWVPTEGLSSGLKKTIDSYRD